MIQFCRLLFKAFLAQQREHVLLVSLHAGLVEGVHVEQVTADGASHLEEINQFAKDACRDFGDDDADVGHATVLVGQNGAQFGFVVHLADALARNVVQLVEVVGFRRDVQFVVGVFAGRPGCIAPSSGGRC